MSTFTDVQSQGKSVARQAEEMPPSVYFGAVIGSIVLSAVLFLLGRRNLGIFVGLWPPTILNMALFAKQLCPSRDMENADQGIQREMQDLERRYGT